MARPLSKLINCLACAFWFSSPPNRSASVSRTNRSGRVWATCSLITSQSSVVSNMFERYLEAHVPLWTKAAAGQAVDWDALFEGYRSAVDFPAAAFYREIADHFPSAKIILTVRDKDRWFQSFSDTIRHPLVEPMPPHLADWGNMVHE